MLQECPELWDCYFNQVVRKKLDPHETLRESLILNKYIEPFQTLDEKPVLDHYISFHVHLYVHHLDILRIERALKPMTILLIDPGEAREIMGNVECKSSFTTYIVDKLYDYLCSLSNSQMSHWLNAYRKVVSINHKHIIPGI